MTDFGRRTALHAADHEDGGSDEIDVAALSGELADEQPAKAHALGGAKHTAATLAELNAKISDATLDKNTDSRPPSAHKTSHQSGGTDEIDVSGLVGATARAILGDATAGRTLRASALLIKDGTTGVSLKCQLVDLWNGDDISETDDISKGATTGHFSLSSGGGTLTIEAAGLSGNVLHAHGYIGKNASGTALIVVIREVGDDIYAAFTGATDGAVKDLTDRVDSGDVHLYITYITDA